MDCVRINCAHDDKVAWARMLDHVRRAEQATGRTCRILMDLAGPKIRTGPVEPGPAVAKVKPTRDALGRVTRPARIWIAPDEHSRKPPSPADAAVALPAAFLKRLKVGDRLRFTDARESERAVDVVAVGADGCWAESTRTCYLTSGIQIGLQRGEDESVGEACLHADAAHRSGNRSDDRGEAPRAKLGCAPGRPAVCNRSGRILNPHPLAARRSSRLRGCGGQ